MISRPIFQAIAALRDFLRTETAGGFALMTSGVAALIVANSPMAAAYFGALAAYVVGLSILHWINDGLMALFFLLVGLEIKRKLLEGQLRRGPLAPCPASPQSAEC
jgi:NhaA family Na+:H+ antiporter